MAQVFGAYGHVDNLKESANAVTRDYCVAMAGGCASSVAELFEIDLVTVRASGAYDVLYAAITGQFECERRAPRNHRKG